MPLPSISDGAPAAGPGLLPMTGLQAAHAQIALHRPFLQQVARRHLRNDAWADDAVSETMLAAIERPNAWGGRALIRTWLMGILKHKLVDQVRRHTRERPFADVDDTDAADGRTGGREDHELPAGWGDPAESAGRLQLRQLLERCLTSLPELQARALVMNDWRGEETTIICRELGISANHLGVVLFRARRRMRSSLQGCGVSSPQAM